jgi:hypothetical protein
MLAAWASSPARPTPIHPRRERRGFPAFFGDRQQLLALTGLETPFDKEEASLEQATDFFLKGFAFAGQAARCLIFGRRSAALQLGLGVG